MDGGMVAEEGRLYDLLDVLLANRESNPAAHPMHQLRERIGALRRRLDQYNPAGRARRNVAHHYDLNGRLYSLFLDRDRQYSCAYFPRGDETLEEAQSGEEAPHRREIMPAIDRVCACWTSAAAGAAWR